MVIRMLLYIYIFVFFSIITRNLQLNKFIISYFSDIDILRTIYTSKLLNTQNNYTTASII